MKKNIILLLLLLLTVFLVFSESEDVTEIDTNMEVLSEEVEPNIAGIEGLSEEGEPNVADLEDSSQSTTKMEHGENATEESTPEEEPQVIESTAIEEIVAGKTIRSTLYLKENLIYPTLTFAINVSEETFGINLSITKAIADLDLFVYKFDDETEETEVVYSSETDSYNESLFLSRLSDTPLTTGLYYVDVTYQYDYLPKKNKQPINEIEFSLSLTNVSSLPSEGLKPGKSYKLKLLPENGMFVSASLRIPKKTKTFRVDVFDTNADIDIFAAVDNPAMSRDNALYAADSFLSSESLIIDNSEINADIYYLSFVDQAANQLEQEFSVIVTLDANAPDELLKIPNIPLFGDSFDTALISTVEIITENSTGSGCLVSGDGHILTNFHVIEDQDGNFPENIYVAISLFNDQSPKELFSASVVDFDKKLDISLIKIDKGRYGQDLPDELEFPFLQLGNSKEISIGQPIGIIGYPNIGGAGSKSTITFTKGVIGGFEKIASVTYLKLNALISKGNSGGAVINAYYELLALPSYMIEEGTSGMGYAYPIESLPEKWVQIINESQ